MDKDFYLTVTAATVDRNVQQYNVTFWEKRNLPVRVSPSQMLLVAPNFGADLVSSCNMEALEKMVARPALLWTS
uniref:Phospholipase D n=1 Tax=Oryza punctata TaxID=4537 RepID=A0A0E0LDA9_ORYPU